MHTPLTNYLDNWSESRSLCISDRTVDVLLRNWWSQIFTYLALELEGRRILPVDQLEDIPQFGASRETTRNKNLIPMPTTVIRPAVAPSKHFPNCVVLCTRNLNYVDNTEARKDAIRSGCIAITNNSHKRQQQVLMIIVGFPKFGTSLLCQKQEARKAPNRLFSVISNVLA
jgi:hypothetical protein